MPQTQGPHWPESAPSRARTLLPRIRPATMTSTAGLKMNLLRLDLPTPGPTKEHVPWAELDLDELD